MHYKLHYMYSDNYSRRDGTIWNANFLKSNSVGQKSKEQVLKKGGPVKFIMMRSNDAKDIFLELLTHSTLSDAMS